MTNFKSLKLDNLVTTF